MKNIDEMNAKELRDYAETLVNKASHLENKITKTAVLKHNIYRPMNEYITSNEWSLTEEEKKQAIEEYTNSFELIATKGTEFSCQCIYGVDYWSTTVPNDFIYRIDDEEWIKNNLENIQEVK